MTTRATPCDASFSSKSCHLSATLSTPQESSRFRRETDDRHRGEGRNGSNNRLRASITALSKIVLLTLLLGLTCSKRYSSHAASDDAMPEQRMAERNAAAVSPSPSTASSSSAFPSNPPSRFAPQTDTVPFITITLYGLTQKLSSAEQIEHFTNVTSTYVMSYWSGNASTTFDLLGVVTYVLDQVLVPPEEDGIEPDTNDPRGRDLQAQSPTPSPELGGDLILFNQVLVYEFKSTVPQQQRDHATAALWNATSVVTEPFSTKELLTRYNLLLLDQNIDPFYTIDYVGPEAVLTNDPRRSSSLAPTQSHLLPPPKSSHHETKRDIALIFGIVLVVVVGIVAGTTTIWCLYLKESEDPIWPSFTIPFWGIKRGDAQRHTTTTNNNSSSGEYPPPNSNNTHHHRMNSGRIELVPIEWDPANPPPDLNEQTKLEYTNEGERDSAILRMDEEIIGMREGDSSIEPCLEISDESVSSSVPTDVLENERDEDVLDALVDPSGTGDYSHVHMLRISDIDDMALSEDILLANHNRV